MKIYLSLIYRFSITVGNMKGRVVRKLKEMGIRKVEGKKLELYNYYTLCMFLDKVEKGEKLN